MQSDKTTLKDLSCFTSGEGGIFQLLDFCSTLEGRETLRRHILSPPRDLEALLSVQQAIRFFADHPDVWTTAISNGTLVLLEKFFESADNTGPPQGNLTLLLGAFLQRLLHRSQYSFTQFSVSHLADFIKGCQELISLLERPDLPPRLQDTLEHMREELASHPLTKELAALQKNTPYRELAMLSYRARRELKSPIARLMHHYAKLDAWQALARASVTHGWVFPELLPSIPVVMQATGLRHPLLRSPVAYDIDFSESKNFMLLTGANMSGKTTFMRALGVGALLAHLGCAVPATAYRLSFLEGIITNMHIEDNLMLGESYFYAEVLRMKLTAEKLQQPLPHLVLMDELFKGTNVHDAYECTRAVVEGLLAHKRHLIILSTHLYEVAQQFSTREDILFSYFVTDLSAAGNYSFTYQLRPGISNDRIGYRILLKEGVIDLLHQNKA